MFFNNNHRKPVDPTKYDIEPKTDGEKALTDAVRTRMKELAEAPLTARTLVEMSDFAQCARRLLIVGKAPGALGVPAMIGDDGFIGALGYDMPIASSSSSETFGASAIREIVAAVGKMNEKKENADDVVRAIAEARKQGLEALADKLEKKLLDALPAPSKPAALPPPARDERGDVIDAPLLGSPVAAANGAPA